MKLLHPEVEITPGRAGMRPQSSPYTERQPLPGSVVVRLVNETSQENAYNVRLRCDNPFWQEGWYTVLALPPTPGPDNAPPAGKPEQRGPHDRSVTVYVPRGGTRDILIRFNVPAQPESRAGRYEYRIEVETKVTGSTDGARRRDRLASLPAFANVRPFYKWGLDLTPEQRRVGRRRRTGEFEAVVTNEGNDWLYCDLQLPRPKDMLLDAPTLRLAVPPPEPGELLPATDGREPRPGTQRIIPVLATTRLKVFRGELTPQPLLLTALRVDAPSLPPPPEDGYLGLGTVLAAPTSESQPIPGDRALIYAPPIPAKFIDFFSHGASSVRNWIMPVLALLVAIPLLYIGYQRLFLNIKIDTLSLPEAGKKLVISGPNVAGSKVLITGKIGEREIDPVTLDTKLVGIPPKTNECSIIVPQNLDHLNGKLTVQRIGGLLTFLPSSLAIADTKNIQVGSPLVSQVPNVTPVDPGPYPVHGSFTISGSNLGSSGYVLVGGQRSNKTSWSASAVTVTIPQTLPASANPVPVSVRLANGGAPLDAGSITIANTATASTPPSPSPSSPSSPAPSASSSPGKSSSASSSPGSTAPHVALINPASPILTSHHIIPPKSIYIPPKSVSFIPHGNSQAASLTGEDYLLRDNYQGALSAVSGQETTYAHAIRAIAYAKQGQVDQANTEVTAADASATTPADKALALVAHGWIARQQKQYPAARDSFANAANADSSSLLVQVSAAEGQKNVEDRYSHLSSLQGNFTPIQKADIAAQLRDLKQVGR